APLSASDPSDSSEFSCARPGSSVAVLHSGEEARDIGGLDVLVEGLIDEEGGGSAAGAEALQFDEGEAVIVGGIADVDLKVGLDRLGQLGLAAELAGDGAADGDQVAAFGAEPVFLVEGCGVEDIGGGQAEKR